MARSKDTKSAAQTIAEALQQEAGEGELEDEDELRALAELDAGGDTTFQIWRVMPIAKKGFVGQMGAAELTIEKIQTEYGAGRYRVRGIKSDGTYAGQKTIDIAEGLKAAAPAAPAGGPTSLQEYISLQYAQRKEASEERKEWAMILAPIIAAMIPNLFGNKGPTLADLTTTLTNMKALTGGNESAQSKLSELKDILSIVKEMAPEDRSGGTTWPDLIKDGIKEVAPVLGALAQRALPPGMAPPQTVAQENLQLPEGQNPMIMWFMQQLDALVHQASRNKDPGLYAEVLLDNIPEGADPTQLLAMLKREDWWTQLSTFYPKAKPYPQWLADCRAELIKGLEIMLTPPTETEKDD